MVRIGDIITDRKGREGVIKDIKYDVLKPIPTGICIDARYLMHPTQMIGGTTDHQYLVNFKRTTTEEEATTWVDGPDIKFK